MDQSENVKLAVLEEKYDGIKQITSRIEDAIEKLSEVNSNVSRMLAVHEERISNQEETDSVLFVKIDKLRDKVDGDCDGLRGRIQILERKVWIGIGVVMCFNFIFSAPRIFATLLTPEAYEVIIPRQN